MTTKSEELNHRIELLDKAVGIQVRMEMITRLQEEIVTLEQERNELQS